MSAVEAVVDIQRLSIDYRSDSGLLRAVNDVSLRILSGQSYALIGESGSGKSSIAYGLVRYLQAEKVAAQRLMFAGIDLLAAGAAQLRELRGGRIGMVYQDPMSALNPLMRVGGQISEVLRLHGRLNRQQARIQTLELLRKVRFDQPDIIARRLPHELSGGQQQRVVIAMAIACRPQLLILDEPTTGLDVTTEASILQLINELRTTIQCAVLFISHNLAVVRQVCERIGVMQRGVMVEEGDAEAILQRPSHPYTQLLLKAALDLNGPTLNPGQREPTPTLLSAQSMRHSFARSSLLQRWRGQHPAAVIDDIALRVNAGRTLAIVGESGSGKSTLARCIAGLIEADSGTLSLSEQPLPRRLGRRSAAQTRAVQVVLQNPEAALNPAHTVFEIIIRPLRLYGLVPLGDSEREHVLRLLRDVSLDESHLTRYPRQLSGGQKQRVAIARAFAAQPQLIICDEPTSALDISVQAAILDQLRQLQARHGTALVLISHDLGVVRQMADEVVVMHHGRIIERGDSDSLFNRPQHAYTRALLAARPSLVRPCVLGIPQEESEDPVPAMSG